MAANSAVYQFEVTVSAELARSRMLTALTRAGGRITASEPAMISAEVGSVSRTEFRGVWATSPIDLPATLVIGFVPVGVSRCVVHLTITDGLTGLRFGTRNKYAQTFDTWARLLQVTASDGVPEMEPAGAG